LAGKALQISQQDSINSLTQFRTRPLPAEKLGVAKRRQAQAIIYIWVTYGETDASLAIAWLRPWFRTGYLQTTKFLPEKADVRQIIILVTSFER
jgi:hypothetical protein